MQTQHKVQAQPRHTYGGLIAAIVSMLVTAGLVLAVLMNSQALFDWWRLHDYSPDASIVMLANDTKMTDESRHLFYVNHPEVLTGSAFSSHCSVGAEKTVILGCYQSRDQGIFLYNVTDARLKGVVETTAAHEMLHAAYDRLSATEKTQIDTLLNTFYASGLQDERVKQTIEAYKQSEPNELPNEMHSIFATEVTSLPPALETYYKQYFSDRGTVVAMAQHYQAEFTSRRDRTNAYDAQLAQLKKTIDSNQNQAAADRRSLGTEYSQLKSSQRSASDEAYNQLVAAYNTHVVAYNSLLSAIREEIAQYNQIVEQRNAVALEERDLAQALSGDSAAK